MPSFRVCPECREQLSQEARRCACGWKQDEGKKFDPFHGKCSYTDGMDRCRFPGVMSDGQRGEGTWKCAFHAMNGDPIHAARIIQNSFDWDGKPESYLRMRKSFQARSGVASQAGSQGIREIPATIRELVQGLRLRAPDEEAA